MLSNMNTDSDSSEEEDETEVAQAVKVPPQRPKDSKITLDSVTKNLHILDSRF